MGRGAAQDDKRVGAAQIGETPMGDTVKLLLKLIGA